MRTKIETQKYVYAFIITAVVFFGALILSNNFSKKRLTEIKSIENKISLDILSSETQFALLKESSCRSIDHSTAFSDELSSLAARLSYMEENLGDENLEVTSLKKYYSLLQIKDYLLVAQINQKCGIKPLTIIYFYSNQGDCVECRRAGYVLTKLREDYPELRVYSFDYNLDLSAVKTMRSIHSVKNTLPAFIIGDKSYYGFKSPEDMEKLIPELAKIRAARDKAESLGTSTSTKR